MASSLTLSLDGRSVQISIRQRDLERVHDPVVREMARRGSLSEGRFVVFLAGPPGSGKTTLSALWAHRAEQLGLPVAFQALPMDGFHLPNAELEKRSARTPSGEEVPLRRLKGSPWSYDLEALSRLTTRLRMPEPARWPRYDRTIHDPVPEAIPVLDRGVVIVEGNFLLHREPGLPYLRPLADLAILVECAEEISRSAILERYRTSGRGREEILRHIEEVDAPNWRRAMEPAEPPDVVLMLEPRRVLRIVRVPPPDHSDGQQTPRGL